jgi:hypothetical protein
MSGAETRTAQEIARHVKAALLHLRQAENLAELAGIDLYASKHDVPEAGLIRAASEAIEDLGLWAVSNARVQGADPGDRRRWFPEMPPRLDGESGAAACIYCEHGPYCLTCPPGPADGPVCQACHDEIQRRVIVADPYYQGDYLAMFGDDE